MKKTALLIIFTAAFMQAATIQVTADLDYLTGQTIDGANAGPYGISLDGSPDIPVFCINPLAETQYGVPYTATVTRGDIVPGISQADFDFYAAVDYLASVSGNPTDPKWQDAIWNRSNPLLYPDNAAIQSICSAVALLTIFPGEFEAITAPGEQPFVAFVPVAGTPEPASWTMGLMGLVLMASGWRRAWRRGV